MDNQQLQEDFEDFFEHSLCGFITANSKGEILRCNSRLADWLQYQKEALNGRRFSSLLPIGNRMYYETHLSPLLRLQGFFDEVAIEITDASGERLPFLLNGCERRDADGNLLFVRFILVKASDRYIYEQNLRTAKANAETHLSAEREMAKVREQFIAVLGHDLRNPLSGINGGADMLLHAAKEDHTRAVASLIKRSASRMGELVENIMDFARARLGSGISLAKEIVALAPVLTHVIDELRSGWTTRKIETCFSLALPVYCDSARISQLLSNLVANALTHGLPAGVVRVFASVSEESFELSVSNMGKPIPQLTLTTLFEPFTRESTSPSKHGLGLGLYISSEIARAHGGTLTVVSGAEETCFTFRMARE